MSHFSSTRRRFMLGSAAILVSGGLALTADVSLVEPLQLRVVYLQLVLDRLPIAFDGFRIAQIGDCHYDGHFTPSLIERAVKMVNSLQPQLVVLMGDYVTLARLGWDHEHHKAQARADAVSCAQILRGLRPSKQIIGVLGNHDRVAGGDEITATLKSSGLRVLRNQGVWIEYQGSRMRIVGVDDPLEGKPDLESALQGVPHGEFVILLAHEPDFADEAARYPIDLQLSGHSHGGQVRFPMVGPLYLPDLAHKYPMGLYQVGALRLYTNSGLGTIRMPIRVNCPPEVTLLTLRCKSQVSTRPP